MTASFAILIAIAVLILFLVIKAPIWIALALSGAVGLILIDGFAIAMTSLVQVPLQALGKPTLIIIPLFILMGMFIKESGLVDRAFAAIQGSRSRLPGGLAVTTIATSAAFGAVAGTSAAVVGSVGRLSITEMVKNGYDKAYASGTVAAAGTLGILIPPSIVLVVYGQITEESIGALLLAGVIPGLISAIAMMVYASGRAVLQPSIAGGNQPAAIDPNEPRKSRAERFLNIWGLIWRVLGVFGVVIGGIYSGLFTPTESAAIAVCVAFAILLWDRRKDGGRAVRGAIGRSFMEAGVMSGTIMSLLLGSAIFSVFVVRSGIPRIVTEWMTSLNVPVIMIVIIILLLLIPLGMFIDGLSMILITMPILFPVLDSLGVNGIWFAVLMVKMCELGLITPPVGLNLFVTARSVRGLAPETVLRGVWPYYVVDIAVVILLILLPGLVTWLPDIAR
ncbi:TRAP transporter large permease [Agrococcus sp. TSP3-2-1]|uniref:TRAP transporter large permease n=1 Tax=Agrococcus sp. TSP3-2-1 TaxID=2804583 RepID=UPI003CF01A12